MPNHVLNELIFQADAATQERILAKLCNDKGDVDFEILIPTPPNVWLGNVGQKHEKLGLNGLDWSRQNWGTKWNAYSHKPTERTETTLTLRFNTAWSPPFPWLVAAFNTLKASFEHNWLDEGDSRGHQDKWDFSKMEEAGFADPWTEARADDAMNLHLHEVMWGAETAREIMAEMASHSAN